MLVRKFLDWLIAFVKRPFVNLTSKQVMIITIIALIEVVVAGVVLYSPFSFWEGVGLATAAVIVLMLANAFVFHALKRFSAWFKLRAQQSISNNWIDPRIFCNLIALGLLWIGQSQLALLIGDFFSWGVTVFVFGLVFHQGLQELKAQEGADFTVGLLMVLGNPWPVRVRQGWGFFLLYGFLFNFIPIKVTKINKDVEDAGFTVPHNNVAMMTRLSLTFGVNHKTGRGLFNWQKSGGEEGVKNILADMTRERLRIWGASDIEGPRTWQEAKKTGDEAVAILFKRLVGTELTPVESGKYATTDLLTYTRTPRPKPSSIQEGRCGPDWSELDAAWKDYDDVTDTAGQKWEDAFGTVMKRDLLKQIDERRKDIENTRTGNGEKGIRDLGMTLYRLNLSGEIKTQDPEIEGLAQRLEKEAAEKASEDANLKSRIDQMGQLKTIFGDLSDKEVLEATQVEAGHVKKQVIRVDGGAVPLLHVNGQNPAGGV